MPQQMVSVSGVGPYHEGAKKGQEVTLENFLEITDQIRTQPEWRRMADREADYYDGNQLDQDTLAEMESRGIPPIETNLIQPTIDVVLGVEARSRLDWKIMADEDVYQDVAEALSKKIHESERESRADKACANAYASQIKTGIGWVEVNRNSDPFRYAYRVADIHRREVYWDWTAREMDLADASYVVRRKWYDVERVVQFFPEHKDVIRAVGYGWPAEYVQMAREDTTLSRTLDSALRFSLEEYEWRDLGRRRIALYEVFVRRWVRGQILRTPEGVAVEFNKRNPLHVEAVNRGIASPERAVYSGITGSLWAGPHKLTEYPAKRIPYIPFWGYREDLTGIPYGLIRGMMSAQDKINMRESKLQWQLSAKRVIMDSDSLDLKSNTVSEVLDEVARPDAVIILNPSRRNPSSIDINDNIGLSNQQYEVLAGAKDDIQKVRGIFNAMLGSTEKASDSGVAINQLVEQGMTVLASIYDNYNYARRSVGNALLDLIREDLVGRPVQVMIGEGRRKRTVILNNEVQNPETGEVTLENDVQGSQVKLALGEVPTTPAYRAQQLQITSEIMSGLPPEAQIALLPSLIELTDLPHRDKVAEQLRKQFGVTDPVDPAHMTPEEQQEEAQSQEIAQVQSQMSQKMVELQLAEQEAKVMKLRAEAENIAVGKGIDPRMQELEIQEREAKVQRAQLENSNLVRQSVDESFQETGEDTRVKDLDIAEREARVEKTKAEVQRMSHDQPQPQTQLSLHLDKVIDQANESLTQQSKVLAEANTKAMELVGKSIETGMRETARALQNQADQTREVIKEMKDAVTKPRVVELTLDSSGKPTGAVSRVEGA